MISTAVVLLSLLFTVLLLLSAKFSLSAVVEVAQYIRSIAYAPSNKTKRNKKNNKRTIITYVNFLAPAPLPLLSCYLCCSTQPLRFASVASIYPNRRAHPLLSRGIRALSPQFPLPLLSCPCLCFYSTCCA